jgi:urease accessory protein
MPDIVTLHEQLGRLDAARELRGYQAQPAQMRAAGPGEVGELRLGFSIRDGRSVLHGLCREAPLYRDEAIPELPICSIILAGGGVLQGDRYRIEISVGEAACALVQTQNANRIHQMNANDASQHQANDLAPGAYQEYLPDFTISHRGSRFITRRMSWSPQM